MKSENPGLSIGETAKKLGEMWSKQSIKDRAPFEQKAMKLREKYEKVGELYCYKCKNNQEFLCYLHMIQLINDHVTRSAVFFD